MKRVRIDNSDETLLLTGMIVSDRFLREVQSIMEVNRMKSSHSRKIARWCLEYYEQHKCAPGIHIQNVFEEKVETGNIEGDEVQMVSRVLDRISSEFDRADKFNIDYVLKRAESFFGREDIKEMCEKVLELAQTDTLEAQTYLESYRSKKLNTSEGVDPFGDSDLISRAFEEDAEPLMKIPGCLGKMMNPDLCRGSFVALMGQEKIGKTWNLMEFAFTGALSRANVAFFQAGDMNEVQQTRRMQIRVAGRSNKEKYCGEILIPVYDCAKNQQGICDKNQRPDNGSGLDISTSMIEAVTTNENKAILFEQNESYEPCDFCRRRRPRDYVGSFWYKKVFKKVLTSAEAIKASQKFKTRMKGRHFKMVTYPSDTLTPSMIRSHIDNWAYYDGFVPDVIIIDYADIMEADDRRLEHRHKQNSIWKNLRGISTEYNCLVMTATQADANAYGKESLGLNNFSEDKRKYAHVTSMYTINQTPAEKAAGISRIGQLIIRDEDFDTRRQAKLLQCFSIGRAHLGSYF